MTTGFLIIFVLFSAIIGYGLAGNHTSVWIVVCFTFASIAALQITYIATLVVEHFYGSG